jgi:hypothetical protein
MAVNQEMLAFVKEALVAGMPRAQIADTLQKAGWDSDQIKRGLAAYVDVPCPVPVPSPRVYVSAREAFVYLVLFSTLYLSAFNLGGLIFDFINRAFPDVAANNLPFYRPAESMRWHISTLVVAFPVFLFVSRYLYRAIARDPTMRGSRVRKWLTYLTMFIAVDVLIGDVIALIYHFLSGELTVRFFLKVITVAVISGMLFLYYLVELRHEEQESAT